MSLYSTRKSPAPRGKLDVVTGTQIAGAADGSRRREAYCLLLIVMMLWSGNFIVGRATGGLIAPFTLAFIRWTGALLLVAPFARRSVAADAAQLRASWRNVWLLGLTGVAAFNAFIYSGLRETSATNALLLQAAIPALVLIANRLIYGVVPPHGHAVGVSLSVAGVIVIVSEGNPGMLVQFAFGRGDLLVFAGAVSWSLYTVLLRRRPAVRPISLLTVTFAIGVMTMLPFAATEWAQIRAIPWRPPLVAACLYVAILPSLVAYALYNRAVGLVGAAAAGHMISLMPVFGALLAAVLLGETLRAYHLAAMTLIVAGLWIAAAVKQRGSG